MESKITILELAEKLNALKSAVVFSHTRPDGDTIGAGLAILHYLKVLYSYSATANKNAFFFFY